MGKAGAQKRSQFARRNCVGSSRQKKAGEWEWILIDEEPRSQNLISACQDKTSYDESGNCQDTIESMIQNQPELTRRTAGSVTVQAFFTEEERQKFKSVCNDTGSNMAHVLRVLALKWMEEKGGAS